MQQLSKIRREDLSRVRSNRHRNRPHPRDLKATDIDRICGLWAAGVPAKAIAAEFQVSRGLVHTIVEGRTHADKTDMQS